MEGARLEGGQLLQESYMSYSRIGHFVIFFTWFPCIDISFCYFYRFSIHTRTYCKNLPVKISNIKVSTGL